MIGMMIYLHSIKPADTKDSSVSYKLLNSAENGENEKVILVDDFSDEEGEEEDVELESVPPKPSTYIGPFSKYCFLIPMAVVVTYPIEMFPFLVR